MYIDCLREKSGFLLLRNSVRVKREEEKDVEEKRNAKDLQVQVSEKMLDWSARKHKLKHWNLSFGWIQSF